MVKRSLPIILLVDDSQLNLDILYAGLEDLYQLEVALNGHVAIEKTNKIMPDLIILDIMMPEVDGIAVYKILQADPNTAGIPVVFVTAVEDVDCKIKLLELGAADYITKPYNIQEVRARIKMHLRQVMKRHSMQQDIDQLTQNMSAQQREMKVIANQFQATVINMMIAKSKETGSHLLRTKFYLSVLSEGYQERFGFPLQEAAIEAAVMHDIGKIGIPDNVLMKPGRLTSEEYCTIKKHTEIGREILETNNDIHVAGDLLNYAKEIAYYHHERWDGAGYPEGLEGDSIPLSARMMSLADVYDALVSERIYKQAMQHQEAVQVILAESGKAFDPELVAIFLEKHIAFQKINEQYKDEEERHS